MAEVEKQRAQAVKSDDGQVIVLPTRTRPRLRQTTEEKGVLEARKGLLNLVLTNTQAASALAKSGYISPEEMGDELYSQLLVLAFKNAENKRNMPPADIIAHFEVLEDQQKIAEIFAVETLYKSDSSMEKALNEMASIIKRAWFTLQMDTLMQKNDLNAVNNLFLSKRNMASLYITMSDG